jgi:hypothetical protein
MKTSIEVLQTYGGKYYFHEDALVDYFGYKCIWDGGGWHREGYGETQEQAASIVVQGLEYIMHHQIRQIEAEHRG